MLSVAPLKVVIPLPTMVIPYPPPPSPIAPEKVSAWLGFTKNWAFPVRVTAPLRVFAPEVQVIAPFAPAPATEIALAKVAPLVSKSSSPPLRMVIVPVPRQFADWAVRVPPALTVVPPE